MAYIFIRRANIKIHMDRNNASDELNNTARKAKNTTENCEHVFVSTEKLRNIEEEHELLNSSLFALTTHFAQVQLRLKQVVNASEEDRQALLISLEEFAFRGIPNMGLIKKRMDEVSLADTVKIRRTQQRTLVDNLKYHLQALEKFTRNKIEPSDSKDVILEKQNLVLKELRSRMNLALDDHNLHRLSETEIRSCVNSAFDQMINPLKSKEHLVLQLQTQISDMEKFIRYLQTKNKINVSKIRENVGLLKKIVTIMQMIATVQLGCIIQYFNKHKTRELNFRNLVNKLEKTILKLIEIIQTTKVKKNRTKPTEELVTFIRKNFSDSLRDLIQHGTTKTNSISSIFCINYFLRRNPKKSPLHAWEIILLYYKLQNGEQFCTKPSRKLSESFNLQISENVTNSDKENLIFSIGDIISTHTVHKLSYDSHFRAFVCSALNAGSLVVWLDLIFQCNEVVRSYYQSWSYVAATRFEDSFKFLDLLSKYKFDLPVDLDVRKYRSIKDIFM